MAYQQGPPGQPPNYGPPNYGPPGYGPPPGYGYPPPPPPGRSPLFWIFVVGLPVAVLFGCTAAVVLIGTPTSYTTSSRPPSAQASPTNGVLVDPYTAPVTQGTAPAVETQQPVQPSQVPPVDPASAKPAPVAVGGTLALQGLDPGLKVDVTVTRVVDRATPASDILKPQAGNRYVAVELQLTNKGQVAYQDAPPNGSSLIDDQGHQYRTAISEVREGVSLTSVTISPGDSRKGVVLFEVPEAVKVVKFQFGLNSGFASQKGEWTIGS